MRLVAGTGARHTTYLGFLGGLTAWASPLVNVVGGLEVLPKALAERLDVRLNTEALLLEENADGVTLSYRDEQGEQQINADVAVIGAMFDAAQVICPAIKTWAGDYRYEDVKLISISLAYRAKTRSRAYAVQVPSVELPDTLLMFLQHNKAHDRAPAGCSLITVYTDTRATDRYLEMSDEAALTRWTREQVEKLFPELNGTFEFGEVARWPKAGCLATPGFFARTQKLMANRPQASRIQLAGDLLGAGSMESAVRWGDRAAEAIIATTAD